MVIECALSVNLTSLTLEQVLGKRKKLLTDMGTAMATEISGPLAVFGEQAVSSGVSSLADKLSSVALKEDKTWYNIDDNFEAAVGQIMKAKSEVLADVERLSLSDEAVDLTGWDLGGPGNAAKLTGWSKAGPKATTLM